MLLFKNITDKNEDAYHESLEKMDLAALQIGGEIDPSRVDLRATSCLCVNIEAMETKCQPGDSFTITKVTADVFCHGDCPDTRNSFTKVITNCNFFGGSNSY